MLRRVMMAGGGAAPSAHRYWRINVSANDGDAYYTGFTEIEFRGQGGGPNLIPTQVGFGAASASSEINGSNQSYMAADGSLTTGWLSSSAAAEWWQFDFGSSYNPAPKTARVVQVAIRGSYNAPNASPRDFKIQWSDNGTAWTDALTVSGQTGWSGASDIRLFDIP